MIRNFTLPIRKSLWAGLLFLAPPTCDALRANSGNLFYRYLGNDRYEIIVHYYKECGGGVQYAATYGGSIRAACGTRNFTITRDSIWDVSQTCFTRQTCNNTSTTGSSLVSIQRYRAVINFRDTLYRQFLGSGCCDVTLSVSLRPRNGANTNMSVSGMPLFLQAGLSLCRKAGLPPQNNSSVQLFPWQIYHTANQPIYQSFRAVDPDGDSLSYVLTPCLYDAANNISYIRGFTYDYPLSVYCGGAKAPCAANPNAAEPRGFSLDAYTGDLVFQPVTATEISAVGVRINEFRRDSSGKYVLMGYTMVEGNIITMISTNNHPIISNPVNASICEQERYCFSTTYSDAKNPGQAAPDTPVFRYFTNIPNFSLVNTPPTRFNPVNTVNVCFTAPAFDSIKEPYFFTVAVFDNFCGTAFESRRTHQIRVRRKPASTLTKTLLPGSRLAVAARVPDSLARMDLRITGPNNYRYERSALRNQYFDTLRLFTAGEYRLELTTYGNGYCNYVIRDTVRMNGCLTLQHQIDTQKAYCRNQPVVFRVSTQNSIGALQYRWSNRFGTNLSQADTLQIRLGSDTLLRLRIDDQFGCFVQDSFRFRTYLPEASWQVPANGICSENEGPEIENWLQFTSKYPGNWQAGTGILTQTAGRWHLQNRLPVQVDTTLAVQFTITDSLACPTGAEIRFPVRHTRRVSVRDTALCREDGNFDIRQLSGNSDTRFMALEWICSNPGTLTPAQVLKETSFIALQPGTYGFTLRHNDTLRQCGAETNFRITRRPVPDYRSFVTPKLCDNGAAEDISRYVQVFLPSPALSWNLLSVNGMTPNAAQRSALIGNLFQPRQAGNWRIGFTDISSGCRLRDSLLFVVLASPKPDLGRDTAIPAGSFIRLDAGPYATYEWDDNSRSQFRNIPASELSITPRPYWVKVNDGLSTCFGSDTLLLSLRNPQSADPLPDPGAWQVYPNPFREVLQVTSGEAMRWQLFRPDGREAVPATDLKAGAQQIETGHLPAGMYILEGRNGNRRVQALVLRLP
ncbi:MAG: T9SS type A sorting domain-containing protein [Bacteroidota bacterium]